MSRDYFAEMYVAGILADHGWNIYFPRRDKGFDFIITKDLGERMLVRPVQVKGLYPTGAKTECASGATFSHLERPRTSSPRGVAEPSKAR